MNSHGMPGLCRERENIRMNSSCAACAAMSVIEFLVFCLPVFGDMYGMFDFLSPSGPFNSCSRQHVKVPRRGVRWFTAHAAWPLKCAAHPPKRAMLPDRRSLRPPHTLDICPSRAPYGAEGGRASTQRQLSAHKLPAQPCSAAHSGRNQTCEDWALLRAVSLRDHAHPPPHWRTQGSAPERPVHTRRRSRRSTRDISQERNLVGAVHMLRTVHKAGNEPTRQSS